MHSCKKQKQGNYVHNLNMKSSREVSGGMGEGGYVREFVDVVWKPLMKQILKKNIKIVTNAGGMNPIALKKAIEEEARYIDSCIRRSLRTKGKLEFPSQKSLQLLEMI